MVTNAVIRSLSSEECCLILFGFVKPSCWDTKGCCNHTHEDTQSQISYCRDLAEEAIMEGVVCVCVQLEVCLAPTLWLFSMFYFDLELEI